MSCQAQSAFLCTIIKPIINKIAMKKILLSAVLLTSMGLCAQTTHHINWFMGVNSTTASMTIEAGDEVKWTWTDALPHTVTSTGASTESFDSGMLTGNGQVFSHTFTTEGVNPYQCEVHAMMQGTITVEAGLGIDDRSTVQFTCYPNPATDVLTITSKHVIDTIMMYDMNGKVIMSTKGGNLTSKIYMEGYPAGTYMVKVVSGDNSKTINVVKN